MSETIPSSIASPVTPLTVTALTQAIKDCLRQLPGVWVIGEVSGLKPYPAGQIYFTLKDKESQINAVIWKPVAKSLPFTLKDGMEILVSGELTVYQSRYQLNIQTIEPRGIGALLLAFENLKKKLAAQGFFEAKRKRALPPLPRKICLVTSPNGAAVQDMLNVIERRFPNVAVLVYPVKVQGDGAAQQIAQAIRTINQESHFADVEVMIVGRGGGSLEDLWAFNEEVVAYAIFESRIPIISAVGHETDFTIADMVADKRALTPTEAGELVVPRLDQLQKQLQTRHKQLELALANRIKFYKNQLARLATHRALSKPLDRTRQLDNKLRLLDQRLLNIMDKKVQQRQLSLHKIGSRLSMQQPQLKLERHQQKLQSLAQRLQTAMERRAELEKRHLESYRDRLEALSPLAVLGRGYSIAFNQAGKSIAEANDVAAGELVLIRLAQSVIVARVESTKSYKKQ